MKIIICDEDKKASSYTRSILYKIAVKCGFDIKVLCMETVAACYEHLLTDKADLIVLETDIAGESGIGFAKRLRDKFGSSLPLIFLTERNDYAAESYEVDADYYLLKPCGEKRIFMALERARVFEKEKTLALSDRENILRLNKQDIIAVEVLDKKCKIYTAKKDYEISITLSKLKQLLSGAYFWHIHRSYIINVNHIEKQVDYDFHMVKGIRIPIRRSQFSEIKTRYKKWMLHKR